MGGWFLALVDVLMEKGLKYVVRAGKRQMVETTLLVFCGLAALGSLVFIAVGAYLSLREFYAPWLSGIIVGGGVMALSIAGSLALWLFMRRDTVPKQDSFREERSEKDWVDNAAYLGEIIGRHLNRRGIRTMDVMIAALAAGVVLGAGSAIHTRMRRPKGGSPKNQASDPYHREPPK
jgi:hypothetical protein